MPKEESRIQKLITEKKQSIEFCKSKLRDLELSKESWIMLITKTELEIRGLELLEKEEK